MIANELPYLNTSVEDISNEIWVDAFGFDGLYEVSNLGRIKSVSQKEVMFGKQKRKLPILIIKQSKSKTKIKSGKICDRLTCGFWNENKRYSINIPRLIYQSFFQKENIDEKVISHKNRLEIDNRLCNLIPETIQKNHSDNMHKFNCRDMKSKLKSLTDKKHIDFVNTVFEKTCRICNETKLLSEFQVKKVTTRNENRNICKSCRRLQSKKRYEAKKLQV